MVGWKVLWEVGRHFERLRGIVGVWVALWEVVRPCKRLRGIVGGWVALWEVGWHYDRLGSTVGGWIALWEVWWHCGSLGACRPRMRDAMAWWLRTSGIRGWAFFVCPEFDFNY